jgi:hypothetical protein
MAGGDDGEFLMGDHPYFLSKPVPLAGDGNDVAMVLRRLPERFTEHEDIAAEVGLLNKRVRPDGFHEVVFGDDLLIFSDEYEKDLKCLGRNGDWLAGTQDSLLFGINPKGSELVKLLWLRGLARMHCKLRSD